MDLMTIVLARGGDSGGGGSGGGGNSGALVVNASVDEGTNVWTLSETLEVILTAMRNGRTALVMVDLWETGHRVQNNIVTCIEYADGIYCLDDGESSYYTTTLDSYPSSRYPSLGG